MDANALLLEQMREDFLIESGEILERLGPQLTQLEQAPSADLINRIFREIHTLKGTAGFVGLDAVQRLAHGLEDMFGEVRSEKLPVSPELIDAALNGVNELTAMRTRISKGEPEGDPSAVLSQVGAVLRGESPIPSESFADPEPLVEAPEPISVTESESASPPEPPPSVESVEPVGEFLPLGAAVDSPASEPPPAPKPKSESTLRVETETLNALMTHIGELLTIRNALLARSDTLRDGTLTEQITALNRLTRQLQTTINSVRLVPLDRLFTRFTTVVRNLSRARNRPVRLVVRGGETLLDRAIVENMFDPVLHMIRNSVDHGLESPDERLAVGKPEEGAIFLAAEQRGENIVLRIGDDGRGIDADRVRKTAVTRGLCTQEEAFMMPVDQAVRLIFAPGFSTAETVTDLSGRGVGMDVVLQSIRRLRGTVEIDTRPGKGTVFIVKLPLTLAVLQVLQARVGRHVYSLPLHSVKETLLMPVDSIRTVQRKEVFYLRNRILPVHFLETILNGTKPAESAETLPAVVVRQARGDALYVVDELVGKQQIVSKPLNPYLGVVPGVEGCAVLPDGSVTLILDVESLSTEFRSLHAKEDPPHSSGNR